VHLSNGYDIGRRQDVVFVSDWPDDERRQDVVFVPYALVQAVRLELPDVQEHQAWQNVYQSERVRHMYRSNMPGLHYPVCAERRPDVVFVPDRPDDERRQEVVFVPYALVQAVQPELSDVQEHQDWQDVYQSERVRHVYRSTNLRGLQSPVHIER